MLSVKSSGVPIVLESSSLREAVRLMTANKCDRLLVADDSGVQKGVITAVALAEALASGINSETQLKAAGDLLVKEKNPAMEIEMDFPDIIDAVGNGIVAVNKFAKIVIFNRAAERILGVAASQALGRYLEEICPKTALSRVLHSGQAENGKIQKVGGIEVYIRRTPIEVNGEVVGAVAVFQDISEIDNLPAKLKKAQEISRELEAVIESSFDGIGVISGDGVVLRVNTSYERITGLRPEDNGVGCNVYDLEKDGHVSKAVALMVLQQRQTVTIKQKIKTGKEVLITGTPVFDKRSRIFRVVCNVRDMTELNNLKAQVENTKNVSERYYNELRELRAMQVDHGEFIASSPKMKKVMELAKRIALVNSNVLITGESGVGKEIIAKIIHKTGNRHKGAFMQINCGAIPDNLLESELFGYEEGAFTGARAGGKMGFFELCHQGTLLLDEIGELPLALQVKLLRVIQEQEIFRIGGTKPHKLNVRILAATNKNLEEMVSQGSFREDLFYRLNVVPIFIPPLRERRQDIVPLTIHFIEKINSKHQTNKRFDPELYRDFEQYDWPGNVRELENVVERLIVTNEETVLGTRHIPFVFSQKANNQDKVFIRVNELIPLKDAGELLERDLLVKAMQIYQSTRKAARALGISHPTVIRKVHKYQIAYAEK